MTNFADDGIDLHFSHALLHDDALVYGDGDEDVSSSNNGLKLLKQVSLHGSLENANWVDLRDENSGYSCLHGQSATLTDITETSNGNILTSDHDINVSHFTIWKEVLAAMVLNGLSEVL